TYPELAFAAARTQAEKWVSEDLPTMETFYAHDRKGCLLAVSDQGADAPLPVGVCVATSYGKSGFIGELVVSPGWRGQGIGATLLDAGVRYLHSQGVRSVYLDGEVKAVPLYERYGFRKVCRSLRLSGTCTGKQHPEVRPMQTTDLPAVFELDRRHFGADRSFFLRRRLERFPELAKVQVQGTEVVGYVLGRRGLDWLSAGPWVVDEANPAPYLLFESLAQEAGGNRMMVGVLADNERAVAFFQSLGLLERPDSPWRMALGPDADLGACSFCLAIGGASKG
ncbi:MAG TPA: GNAT family N-acetyltransferase, partial [Anaerolineaceae bacterium]|nr:GNAT family N-acetyltransferase [Anaerolineaceae bacterium]